MSFDVDRLVVQAQEAEEELARDLREQQQRWRYRVHRGRVWFDKEVRQAHKRLRQSVPVFLLRSSLPNLLTAPVTYSLLVPLLLLDVWATLYQWSCFPIYGVARVSRRPYFVVDRHTLAYLNAIEKVHCVFCSYALGVIGYVREVAARTEQYWCPIKHARPISQPHSHYQQFFEYGDAAGYRHNLSALRKTLRPHRPGAEGRSPRGKA